MKKISTVYDLALAGAVLVIAAVCFLAFRGGADGGLRAEITIDGEKYAVIDLGENESREITLPTDPELTVLAEPGAVSVIKAGCRDKICVKRGRLTKAGDTAVCLPAKVTVSVVGGKNESGVDAVVY